MQKVLTTSTGKMWKECTFCTKYTYHRSRLQSRGGSIARWSFEHFDRMDSSQCSCTFCTRLVMSRWRQNQHKSLLLPLPKHPAKLNWAQTTYHDLNFSQTRLISSGYKSRYISSVDISGILREKDLKLPVSLLNLTVYQACSLHFFMGTKTCASW